MNPALQLTDGQVVVKMQITSGNMASFASRVELTKIPTETAIRYQIPEGELLRTVIAIPGIVGASIRPYDLMVEKADLWTWDEIRPKIWDLLLTVNVPSMTPASEREQ